MQFNQLRLNDKRTFDKFLSIKQHELSVFSFANIFIWKDLFKIYWCIIEDNLCVFFKDKTGIFLYFPPLGAQQSKGLIKKCFEIMDRMNVNYSLSRIENVEQQDCEFYRALGYDCVYKNCDYVYSRKRLLGFRGNLFKSKRAGLNYFSRNYKYDYQPFCFEHKDRCLDLYKQWMENRKMKSTDPIYLSMLRENFIAQKQALNNHEALDLIGRVIAVSNRIKGYTVGYKLNQDTVCVLFEITDLSLKGISQFIFHRFVEEFHDYDYINVMDDSDLDNLKMVKLSYRPTRLIPSYIVKIARDV